MVIKHEINIDLTSPGTPDDGTAARNGNYYRVAMLDAVNAELEILGGTVTAMGGGEYLKEQKEGHCSSFYSSRAADAAFFLTLSIPLYAAAFVP